MKIDELFISIAGREIKLADCTDENPTIKRLLDMATSTDVVIRIEVPVRWDTLGVLNYLGFDRRNLKIKLEPAPKPEPKPRLVVEESNTEMLLALSQPIDMLPKCPNVSVRAIRILKNNGLLYVWQVAEMTRQDLGKFKHLGGCSVNRLHEWIDDLGLEFETDLSKVRHLLPSP